MSNAADAQISPAPIAIIMVGNDRITASLLDDSRKVQIGHRTISVSGPPLAAAGVTFSLGESGELNLGAGDVIWLRSGSRGTTRKAASYKTGWTDSQGGRASIPTTGRPAGYTNDDYASGFLGGKASEELTDVQTELCQAHDSPCPTRILPPKPGDSGAGEESQGGSRRKKSAASHFEHHIFSSFVLLLCCLFGQ